MQLIAKSALLWESMTIVLTAPLRHSAMLHPRSISLPRTSFGLASFCVITVFSILVCRSMLAQTATWTNNANNNLSNSTTGYWSGITNPSSGNAWIFANTTGVTLTNNFPADWVVGGIWINSGANLLALTGGTITLTGNITNSSTYTTGNGNVISSALIVNTNVLITNVSGYIGLGGTVTGTGTISYTTTSATARLLITGGNWSGFSGALILGTNAAQNGRVQLLTNVSSTSADYVMNMSNSGIYLGPGTYTLGSLSGTNGVIASAGSANTGVLAVGYNNKTTTWAGNFSSNNNATGSFGLTKVGIGTLSLSGANTYIGTTTVSDGVLALGTNGTTGSISNSTNINVSGSGVFAINRRDTVVQGGIFRTNAITGTGGFAQIGSGTTILTAPNTFSGDTTVSAGRLVLSNALAIQNSALNLSGGTLSFSNNTSATFGGLKGSGNLNLANSSSVAVALTLNNVAASAANYSGTLSGATSLTLVGSGTQTLSGSNTYSGGTFLNAGTLVIGNTNALSTGSLTITGSSTLLDTNFSFNNPIIISGGSTTLTMDSGAGLWTNTGVISGNGAVLKAGSGTLLLSASNSFSGGTFLNAGTLVLGNSNALSTGTLTVTSSSTLLYTNVSFSNPIVISGGSTTLTMDSGAGIWTNSSVISSNGAILKAGSGTLFLSTSNSYSGGTFLNAGTLGIGNSNALGSGTLTIANGTRINNTSGSPITLNNNSQIWNGDFTFLGSSALNLGSGSVTLGTNLTVIVSSSTLTSGGNISGGFYLTKGGIGTLTLAGTNSYTGTTTVSLGTLLVSGLLGGGSYSSSVTISNGAIFNFAGSSSQSLVGQITGPGMLVVSGSGTLVLAASNNYGGTIVRNGGTLSLSNASALSYGGLTITNGTLSTELIPNSTVDLGFSTMNLQGNSTLVVAADSTSGTNFIVDALLLTGSNNTIINTAYTPFGTYTLIYSFNTIGSTNIGYSYGGQTATLNGAPISVGRNTYALTNNDNNIQLIAAGGPWNISWTGSNNNIWNTNSTNWITNGGSLSAVFNNNDNVTFTNLANNTNIGVTNAGVIAGTMDISNNSQSITFTNGPISATILTIANNAGSITFSNQSNTLSGLVVSGTNNVSMNSPLTVNGGGSNGLNVIGDASTVITFSSNTTLNNANLTINGGTVSNSSSILITNSGSFTDNFGLTLGTGTISGSGSVTALFFNVTNGLINNSLAGGGALTKRGVGTVTLSGANSYTGGTTINDGTLVVSNSSALGSGGALNVSSGTLINNSFNISVSSVTLGNGTISGAGTITLTSSNGFTATNSGSAAVTVVLGNLGALATFTQSGAGTTTLSGSNSYRGGTFVTSGTLVISNSRALGSGINNPLTVSGGTLINDGFNVSVTTVSLGNGTIAGNGTITGSSFTATNTGTLLISNSLAGLARFTNRGTGTTILTASNSYSGGTLATNGTLIASNANALGTGGVTNNGALLDLGGNTLTNIFALGSGTIQNGTISNSVNFTNLSNGTVSANLTGSGSLVRSGAGTLILSGTNSYDGLTLVSSGTLIASNPYALSSNTVSISGGVLNLGGQTFTNTFALSSGLITNGIISNNLIFDQLGAGTVAASLAGSASLTHDDTGTLILSASNSYSGGTLLTNGGIVVGNPDALGSGNLTIMNATLTVTNANTALRVGNGVNLAGAGTITLSSGSSITNTGIITISGASSNVINLNSDWNFSGGFTYTLLSGTNISYGTTNIALTSPEFGRIPYGATINANGTNFTFTSGFSGRVPKSLVLRCVVPVIPIQTLPTIYNASVPPAATNGGVKAISVNPWGEVAAALNGNGEVVPFFFAGSSLNLRNFPSNGISAISSGYQQLMALKNGTVYVAGGGPRDGTVVPSDARSGVTAISGGVYGCLALKQNGTIVAWGFKYDSSFNGDNRVLIDYTTGSVYTLYNTYIAISIVNQLAIENNDPVIGIADGTVQGMVLFKSGNIFAFGSTFAPSGSSRSDASADIPPGLSNNVAAISEGGFFAMALKKDGTVVAWGQNNRGQTDVPAGLSGVISISAGFDYALALKNDGTVVAWGNPSRTNIPSGFQGGITAIEAGYSYSVVARPNIAGNPVDDCQSSGGLQGGGGSGGGGGNVGNRSNPPTRSNPPPRTSPQGSSSSSSGSPGSRSQPPSRSAPPSR